MYNSFVTFETAINPYEHIPASETEDEITRAAQIYRELLPRKNEYRQALINETVQALLATNTVKASPEEKDSKAAAIFQAVGPFFADEWSQCQTGILAEVCTRLSLQKLGFVTIEPFLNDDCLHEIDLFVDPNEADGQIWAIQIKGRRNLQSPTVERFDDSNSSYLEGRRMLEYIQSPEFAVDHPSLAKRPIIPILIKIPTGGDNIDVAMPAFKRTGEPIGGFANRLYDKIAKALGWDKEI